MTTPAADAALRYARLWLQARRAGDPIAAEYAATAVAYGRLVTRI